MRFSQRLIAVTIAVALSGLVAGCSSMNSMNFDPTDLLDFLDTKKKLPGDRRPVFPEGVPGVEQGVPKDLYKGAAAQQDQMQAETAPPPVVEPKTSATQKSKSQKSAAKPQSKPRAAPEIASDPDADADDGVAAAPPAPPAPRKRARTTSLPRDDQPAPQQSVQSQPQAQPAFPAPLPGGSFSR